VVRDWDFHIICIKYCKMVSAVFDPNSGHLFGDLTRQHTWAARSNDDAKADAGVLTAEVSTDEDDGDDADDDDDAADDSGVNVFWCTDMGVAESDEAKAESRKPTAPSHAAPHIMATPLESSS
jgi:hypothetical protein